MTPASSARIHVGVDENGLGPRLGPLIVTAVTARVDDGAARLLGKRPRGGAGDRLGDSKRLASFGDTSPLGEAWASAIVKRTDPAARFDSPAALLARVTLDDEPTLRALCPSHHESMCWGGDGESLVGDGSLEEAVRRDLDRLASRGVEVLSVRSSIVCARRLNDAVGRGLSRFHSDLHAMESLVIDAARRHGPGVAATCGKVGGFDRYGGVFAHLGLHVPLVEGRARSEYRVPGIGDVAFVRDAEDGHLLVAMASLVGKWARDLLMRRIVRFHRDRATNVPEASGYYDPVTTQFIAATALARKTARVDDACFLRRKLETDAGEAPSATSTPSPSRPARTRATPSASRSPRPS